MITDRNEPHGNTEAGGDIHRFEKGLIIAHHNHAFGATFHLILYHRINAFEQS